MADVSATLVYGLSVDIFALFYQARAWKNIRYELAYIDGLVSGRLSRAGDALPPEILSMIRGHLWTEALYQATCKSWVLFGASLSTSNHLPSCCSSGRELAVATTKTMCHGCSMWHLPFGTDDPDSRWAFYDSYRERLPDAEDALVTVLKGAGTLKKTAPVALGVGALREYLSHLDLRIAHATLLNDEISCIVSGKCAKIDLKSPSTSHESQNAPGASAVQISLNHLKSMADSENHLKTLARQGILPTVRYPLLPPSPKKLRKFPADEPDTSGAVPAGSRTSNKTPRFFLIASSERDF